MDASWHGHVLMLNSDVGVKIGRCTSLHGRTHCSTQLLLTHIVCGHCNARHPQAHAAGLDFGPEWLVSWRAAATTKLRVMPAQELPTVLYAHGQMAARSGSQPRQHVAAASTATLQQGAASAEVLPGSRDLAQQSPHTVAQPAEYVPVGELLQFLVAAAKRYKGDKTGSAVFRFSSMAALGTGMYGLVLAAQVGGCFARLHSSDT